MLGDNRRRKAACCIVTLLCLFTPLCTKVSVAADSEPTYFIFHGEPDLISKLQAKFKLDPEVYRQHYQKLREKKEPTKKKRMAEAK